MYSKTIKVYNEMGDGFDLTTIYCNMDEEGNLKDARIIHIGRFADDDMLSSTYVRKDK